MLAFAPTRIPSSSLPDSLTSEPIADLTLLWLCCYLPLLPLEALGLKADCPVAVVEEFKGRPHVLTPSPIARSRGVISGLSLNAAHALCPELRFEARNRALEQQVISALAERCLNFTPWVSLDYSQALLLEVRGSLNLFGGLNALQTRLSETIASGGCTCLMAVTPVPFASWLLARQGSGDAVIRREALRSVLGDLPIAALGFDAGVPARLAKVGLRTLRDLWRLPRDGLARRYGSRLMVAMDRAAGYATDTPRLNYCPPRFDVSLDLPLETDKLSQYFPALEELMKRLTVFLRSHDAAVAELRLALHHRRGAPSNVQLELRQTSRNEAHLLGLLKEKLDRVALPGPVSAVGLSTENIHPHVPQIPDIFGARAADGEREGAWQQLIETLQARLGRNAIRMLSASADHRPENVSVLSDNFHASCSPPNGPRPLWLLPAPRPAPADLAPESGTERIESGWWDGPMVRRDYRKAIDRFGARWWIYREPSQSQRWYVHGLFG